MTTPTFEKILSEETGDFKKSKGFKYLQIAFGSTEETTEDDTKFINGLTGFLTTSMGWMVLTPIAQHEFASKILNNGHMLNKLPITGQTLFTGDVIRELDIWYNQLNIMRDSGMSLEGILFEAQNHEVIEAEA